VYGTGALLETLAAALGGHGWEFIDANGFRVDALKDGEQFHVSMLHVPFGPWQLATENSQPDV